jgi:phosphatidylinositol glycan class O
MLLVLGDHGSTSDGDHGGDSELELEAALFAYSRPPPGKSRPATPRLRHGQAAAVSQIDLTPTIALLLGLPIPFGSLGLVIPELTAFHLHQEDSLGDGGDAALRSNEQIQAELARLNSHQIWRYLTIYAQGGSGGFPEREMAELQALLEAADQGWWAAEAASRAEAPLLYAEVREQYGQFAQATQAMCRAVWATFDVWGIGLGVVLFAASIGVSLLLILRVDSPASPTPSTASARGSGAESATGRPAATESGAPGDMFCIGFGAAVGSPLAVLSWFMGVAPSNNNLAVALQVSTSKKYAVCTNVCVFVRVCA